MPEDHAQDAMERMLRSYPDKHGQPARRLAFTVLRNVVFDEFRRKEHTFEFVNSLHNEADSGDGGPIGIVLVDERSGDRPERVVLDHMVRTARSTMSTAHGDALVDALYSGAPKTEIARRHAVSTNTVRKVIADFGAAWIGG